jgi:DNA-binding beta-propeller fold protein YncE
MISHDKFLFSITLIIFFVLGNQFLTKENVVLAGGNETKSMKYCYDFKWGSVGNEDGQFLRPHDVNFDSKGYVYVSDRDRNDIQKFTPNGTFVLKWGSEGNKAGEFSVPYSIEIDSYDNIFVVDRGNDRIQKFNENGTFIKQWDRPEKINSTDEQFASPEDMVIDPKTGNTYITDTGNERVVKLDRNFSYILDWGSDDGQPSNERGKFNHPHGIDVDSKGYVYVNELENPRIQKFNENGTFVKQWGSEGKGPGEFTPLLEHLEIDPKRDTIFMVDGADNPRIQVFDTDGNFTTSFGTHGSGDGEMAKPEHVNIDSSGNVYVVDRGNQRMQVFSPC